MRVVLALICFVSALTAHAQTRPLPEAHAHNDYWHWPPLQRALNNGFMSVEADIHLLKGDLLVNHEAVFTRRGRNLKRLYLEPLFEQAKANGFKSIYEDGPQEFILYIDIKQGCPHICDTLISQLQEYEQMLTVWDDGVKRTGAVSIIIGACGRQDEWLAAPRRWFYFDGNRGAIGGRYGAEAIPRVGMPLRSVTDWRGRGKMNGAELEELRSVLRDAHGEGREVRFWGATNKPKVWELLLDEGVDIINVDRLKRFRKFMDKREASTLQHQTGTP